MSRRDAETSDAADAPPRSHASAPRALTQDNFELLLEWLDRDRVRAGEKYETIRRKLIRVFAARGCGEAEELADETIDRVARRAREIAPGYTGEPAAYFLGVANKIHLEYLKRKKVSPPRPPPPPDTDAIEREYACLEECMGRLAPRARTLILRYYADEGQAKIDARRSLAAELGVAPSALRLRAHRIRGALQECVVECLGREAEG